ncbi:MAG: hypothetical protein P1V51_11195 [Deltaproteobacteria bacterium]|nr:hypothetical protein [Deltaproteobacteria bacterium]
MSLLSCMEVTSLLEGRAAGLQSAEAIKVEQHLATCAECRETGDYLATFGQLASAVPSLEPRRSERALAMALAVTTLEANRPVPIPRPKHHGPSDLRRVAAFGAGAALVVTLSVIAFAHSLPEQRELAPAKTTRHEALELAPARVPVPAALQTFTATSESVLSFAGGVRISLTEGSELQWRPATAGHDVTVHLLTGSARVLGPDDTLICELGPGQRCALPAAGALER